MSIVMKFGGTSVGNAERIKNAADIVKSNYKKNPVVVVSAVTKITDALIKLANECSQGSGEKTLNHIKERHNEIIENLGVDKALLNEDINELENLSRKTKNKKILDAKRLDLFQSFGERMSSKIVAAQLNKSKIKSKAFDSWKLGFVTDNEFGDAEPLDEAYSNLKSNIKKLNLVPVITGFIGKTKNGEITTLGRGGSDYTAAIVGAAIDSDEIQIWTDVNGIMSTDPKIVSNAKTIKRVSFAEASELAYFGAKVIHPKTILPAMKKNIPVKVLNSFEPKNKGTIILSKSDKSSEAVKAIACKKNISLVHIESTRMLGAHGFLAKIFEVFNEKKKSVDVVSTSEVSVSLTVDSDENIDEILSSLKKIADAEVKKNKAIICVVGDGIGSTPGVAGRIFTALGSGKINVEMISMGASEINITFIVDGNYAEKAVRTLHKEYFGD